MYSLPLRDGASSKQKMDYINHLNFVFSDEIMWKENVNDHITMYEETTDLFRN